MERVLEVACGGQRLRFRCCPLYFDPQEKFSIVGGGSHVLQVVLISTEKLQSIRKIQAVVEGHCKGVFRPLQGGKSDIISSASRCRSMK